MEKKYEGILKQFEISIYAMLTICVLSIYISFSIFQKQRPVRDINSLKNYVRMYNTESGGLLEVINPSLAKELEDEFKQRINESIFRSYGKNPDWALYDVSENCINLVSLNTKEPIVYGASISEILKKLHNGVSYNFPKKFNCDTAYRLSNEPNTKIYLNIRDVRRTDSIAYLVTIVVGKSTEMNSLNLNESFSVKCISDGDTERTSQSEYQTLKSHLPWISTNLNELEMKSLSSFDEAWVSGIDKEVLQEEQTLFGLKIQNFSLSIITLLLLSSIYVFHLSLLHDLLKNKTDFPLSSFSPIMFNNLWAIFLRIILWIALPLISIIMDSFFISKDNNILIIGLPIIALGILIFRNIQKLIKRPLIAT